MKEKFLKWIKAAGIRALKTMAQAALSVLATTTMITEVDWKLTASTVALAGVASLLMSIKGLPELKQTGSRWGWLAAVMIRAARTFAQSAIATIGSAAIFAEVNWPVVLSTAFMAAVLSVITSAITDIPEVDDGEQ